MVKQFTVVDTFSGAGGSSLGWKLANFKELLAVEFDPDAIATFRMNFPEVNLFAGDIAKLSGEEALRITGLKPGELDVFSGSCPCQGFSSSGKRDLNDPRNSLFKEYARLLNTFKPKVFTFENVGGMIKGHMKQVYLQVVKLLRESGYEVKGQVMDACYFGVPQHRPRVIIIGVRKDLGIMPSHPKPFTKLISVSEALKDLVCEPDAKPLTPTYIKYWHETKPGTPLGKFASRKKLHPHRPSFCIPKHSQSIYHWAEPRLLHTGELKRLFSFPDDFKFTTWENAANRMGNSVAPLMMKAIAQHIRDEILSKV